MIVGHPGETPPGTTAIPPDRTSVRHFAARYVSVGTARRHTAEVVRSWALEDVIETAELLASELVTNAIKASIAPRRQRGSDTAPDGRAGIALRLGSTGTSLVIEVWDHDDTPPVLEAKDLTAEGGRGLLLVDTLSKRWAYYRPINGGKVVWCEVELPIPTSSAVGKHHETHRPPHRELSGEPPDWFG